jgi:hypothetical protein
MTVIAMM